MDHKKEEMLKEVCHELRTPIVSILGLSEDLKKEQLKQEIAGKIGEIAFAARHMEQIVREVLDFSRLEAGREELKRESFKIDDLLMEIKGIIEPLCRKKKIDFRCRIYEPGRVYISDPLKITQILLNLLSNAIRYTQEAGRIWFIIRERRKREELYLYFIVADEGKGMDKELLKHLFEPYVKESPLKDSYGLGLAITKRYVDLLSGHISFYSKPGRGTMVLLKIPVAVDDRRDPVSENMLMNHDLRGMKILVGEDVVINAQILEKLLCDHGAKADLAYNGKKASEMFMGSDEGYYDVLLLDVHMPLLDGRSLCRAIRSCKRKDKDVGIIILSADGLKEDFEESEKAGSDFHLVKPLDGELLLEKIEMLKRRA